MSNEANSSANERASVKGCKGQHGQYGAIGTITLQRPAWEVYNFLTRVESQPTWNSSVKRADVVKTTKVSQDIQIKHVQQVMGWGLLALRGTFTMHLCMREDAQAMVVHTDIASPSRDSSPSGSPASSRSSSFSEGSNASGGARSGSSSPSSDAVATALESPASDDGGSNSGRGGFMKRFSSRMTVSELTANSSSLEMQLFMLPSIYVPFGVRSLVGGQVRRQLGGLLQSVKTHVESPDFKPSGSGGSSSEEEQQRDKAGRAVFAPAALTLAV
jgi:hypothetical protein